MYTVGQYVMRGGLDLTAMPTVADLASRNGSAEALC